MIGRKAKAQHLILGEKGEKLAIRLVKELGLEPICCNYRVTGGEIDIIALDGETIIFIEVKTRDEKHIQFLDRPADSVGHHKKARLRKAARHYLRRIKNKDIAYRFDVIEVIFHGKLLKSCHWLKEFFSMNYEPNIDCGFEFE